MNVMIEDWVSKNQRTLSESQLNTFVRLDVASNTPVYIFLKKYQPLESLPAIYVTHPFDLPVGRVFNCENNGAIIGYLFELPKRKVQVDRNWFSVQFVSETARSVRVAFYNKDYTALAPLSNTSMVVIKT